ncbi:MAG: sulfite exporter TauE/SafE family protein [Anaerolineae bacterium]|nr:sulfite exporter TauE/SafE family protein [Anaerolineae bacterium]
MTGLLVAALVFLASLLQSLSGFGFAILVMPVVTLLVGLRIAAPMVALTGLTVYIINLVRYRQAIDGRELARLGLATAIGVPVGIWALVNVQEAVVNRVLGLIMVGYAAYTLLAPRTERQVPRWWVYPAGFLAGCLGGAYNTPGPPVIVYGALRQWPRGEFRAILQALFLVNATLVVGAHLVAGHFDGTVLRLYLWAVPALAVGILAGSRLDARVGRQQFRLVVLGAILGIGLLLLFRPV